MLRRRDPTHDLCRVAFWGPKRHSDPGRACGEWGSAAQKGPIGAHMPSVRHPAYSPSTVQAGTANRETTPTRWARRLITIPAYALMTVSLVVAMPVLLSLSLTVDLLWRRRWGVTRGLLCIGLYFLCETLGLLAAGMLWLAHCVLPHRYHAAYLDWNYALQRWWAATLLAGVSRIFRIEMHVEGADAIPEGPVHVLARHASIADTLLPAACIARGTHRRLRYVLKRELLWDPCLDVVGQRLQNVFVHRSSDDSARERAAVRQLAEHLGPNDGTLIFPEGTRWTPVKRDRILRKLEATGHTQLFQLARALRHTLPPRAGGVTALLEGGPEADVLLLAHTGFEAVTTLSNVWDGSLVGQRVRVGLRRVPWHEIPTDRVARAAWLHDEWRRVDAWIAARTEHTSNPATSGKVKVGCLS